MASTSPNPKVPADERCRSCRGWGFRIVFVGDDDKDTEDCLACDGTGRAAAGTSM